MAEREGLLKRLGMGFDRYVGGLLGEDLSTMTPEERAAARRSAIGIIGRGMVSPEGGSAALTNVMQARAMQRERPMRERAMQDIQQAQAAIAARLGAGGVTSIGGKAYGVGPDVGEQRQLDEVRPLSGYNLPALLASPAGAAALEANPILKSMVEEKLKPEDYTVQSVSGVGLVAVNKRNPRDRFVVQPEVRQPREAPQPTLRQVRLANGMVQDMWIAPGQASGTPVGAPYMPKGAGGEGETLNARQQSGVNMTRDAAYTYASNLTGMSKEELQKKSPAEIEQLIKERGGRVLQGGTARMLAGLPVIGDFARTFVEAQNADLIGPSTTGGAGIAMLQNPAGPISSSDVTTGIMQFPNAMLPAPVQAQMIRSILEQGGRVERYDRNGNPIK